MFLDVLHDPTSILRWTEIFYFVKKINKKTNFDKDIEFRLQKRELGVRLRPHKYSIDIQIDIQIGHKKVPRGRHLYSESVRPVPTVSPHRRTKREPVFIAIFLLTHNAIK